MSIEFDWAKYVDENSSASMQSADFSELPLAKLDWESSRDLKLSHSREGINLELSKVLRVESNSNCSESSFKRSRSHSPDISMSNPKRTKLDRAPGSPANSSAKSSLKKPQINFAEILKATKERQKKKQERFNVSSSVNIPKGTAVAEGGSIIPPVGTSGDGAALINRHKKITPMNDETVVKPPQTSVCANLDTQRWVHTTKTCLMNQDSESETNTPSLSSLSSNRTQMQSTESMSMATSECDMNAVFASSVSSPSPCVTRPEPEACFTQVLFEKPNIKGSSQFQYPTAQAAYVPAFSLRSEKLKKSTSTRKTRFTNARGEVIILTKHQIDMRLRQLSIGKQTWGYQNYIRNVSKHMRCHWHPKTPDAMERISRRRFNGKVNVWRRKLHFWDAPTNVNTTRETNENLKPITMARMEAEIREEVAKYVDYENKEEHGVGKENL